MQNYSICWWVKSWAMEGIWAVFFLWCRLLILKEVQRPVGWTKERRGQKGRERKNNPSLFPSSGTDSPQLVFCSVLQCLIWVMLLTNFSLCIWQSKLLTTLRICSFSHHFCITYCVLLDRILVYLLYYFSPSF